MKKTGNDVSWSKAIVESVFSLNDRFMARTCPDLSGPVHVIAVCQTLAAAPCARSPCLHGPVVSPLASTC